MKRRRAPGLSRRRDRGQTSRRRGRGVSKLQARVHVDAQQVLPLLIGLAQAEEQEILLPLGQRIKPHVLHQALLLGRLTLHASTESLVPNTGCLTLPYAYVPHRALPHCPERECGASCTVRKYSTHAPYRAAPSRAAPRRPTVLRTACGGCKSSAEGCRAIGC